MCGLRRVRFFLSVVLWDQAAEAIVRCPACGRHVFDFWQVYVQQEPILSKIDSDICLARPFKFAERGKQIVLDRSDVRPSICCSRAPGHESLHKGFLAGIEFSLRLAGAGLGLLNGERNIVVERKQEIGFGVRSEEHTSELQSLMRISYA